MDAIQEILNSTSHRHFFAKCDADAAQARYHEYMRRVHPDKCREPGAGDAARKLNEMYSLVKDAVWEGRWGKRETPQRTFTVDGGKIIIVYCGSRRDGTDEYFTAEKTLFACSVEAAAADHKRGVKMAAEFKSLSSDRYAKFAELIRFYVPGVAFKKTSSNAISIYEGMEGYVTIADALETHGSFDPRDAAWITTRLLDACCLYDYGNLVHCGINANTVAIDPEKHGAVSVGWHFAAPKGAKLRAVPASTLEADPDLAKRKTADPATALACVKRLFRVMTAGRRDVPRPMQVWASVKPKATPPEEYAAWAAARDASYERKFHPCEFTAVEVKAALRERQTEKE